MLALLRRRLFGKFLAATLLAGVLLSAAVLAAYHPFRHRVLIGEMAAVTGVLATRLDATLAAQLAAGERRRARELLGLFGAFPYLLCVDYHTAAAGPPAVFWPIPCERMQRAGEPLRLPSAASPGGYFAFRFSVEEIESTLLHEFAVLGLFSAAIALAVLIAAGTVFYLLINRPLVRLVQAIGRFERDNVAEPVAWRSEDEIGRVVTRYNAMLESEVARVAEREARHAETRRLLSDLHEAHEVIASSIHYAANIQRAILPERAAFERRLAEHFVLWEPRDVVGGDFYWIGDWGDGTLLLLGDCTGHGVPGAFMTLIAHGALERARTATLPGDLAGLLLAAHREVRRTLRREGADGADDGLELGACYLAADGGFHFAGARFDLFVVRDDAAEVIPGRRRGLGYRDLPEDPGYTAQRIEVAGATCYLTSDGLLDQVGGMRRRMFGKRRFTALLEALGDEPMERRRERIRDALIDYQGEEARRDDVAVLGFRSVTEGGAG
ncbi:SpoIIE family protein phosphatase [Endothiovibrio diazotrophicus]